MLKVKMTLEALNGLNIAKFDRVVLDGEKHGFALEVFSRPTAATNVMLTVSVADATDLGLQARVKSLLDASGRSEGWRI